MQTFQCALYQNIETSPGEVIQWKLAHKGRQGPDTMKVYFGPNLNESEATFSRNVTNSNDKWYIEKGEYVIPQGQNTTSFVFKAIAAAGNNLSEGNLLDAIEFETRLSAPKVVVNSDLKTAEVYIYSANPISSLEYAVNNFDGQKTSKNVSLSSYSSNHYKGTIFFDNDDDITIGENRIEAWDPAQPEFVANDTFVVNNTSQVKTKIIEKESQNEVSSVESANLENYLLPGETVVIEHEINSTVDFELAYDVSMQFHLSELKYNNTNLNIIENSLRMKRESDSSWTNVSMDQQNSLPMYLLNNQEKYYVQYEVKMEEELYTNSDITLKIKTGDKKLTASLVNEFIAKAKVAAKPTLDIQGGLNIQWKDTGGTILTPQELKASIKGRTYDSTGLVELENNIGSLELVIKSIDGVPYDGMLFPMSTSDYGLYLVEYTLKDTRRGVETEDKRLMGIYDVSGIHNQVSKSFGIIHKNIEVGEVDLKRSNYSTTDDYVRMESEVKAITNYNEVVDLEQAEYKLNGFSIESNHGLYENIIVLVDEGRNFYANPIIKVLESEPDLYFDIPTKIELSKESGKDRIHIGEKAYVSLRGELSSSNQKFQVETEKEFEIVNEEKSSLKYQVGVYDKNGIQSYQENPVQRERIVLGQFGYSGNVGLKEKEEFWLNTKENNNEKGIYKGTMTFYIKSYN